MQITIHTMITGQKKRERYYEVTVYNDAYQPPKFIEKKTFKNKGQVLSFIKTIIS